MRRFVLFSLALLGQSLQGRQIANDWLLVPGRRAGPITPQVTHAGLIRLFGAQNVVDEQVEVNDGGPQFGTVVYKQYPDRQVIVVWRDDKPEHTTQQIRIGTTLKKLEELNSGPFTLARFGFDGSGTVISFRGGALKTLKPVCGAVTLAL